MKHTKIFAGLLTICLLGFLSCETDDILSAVSLEISDDILVEDDGEVTLGATLNAPANSTVNISVDFSGTATIDVDYAVSSNSITINQGEVYGEIVISSISDGLIEGDETILINVTKVDNALVPANTETEATIIIRDGDIDTDGDGIPDTEDECPLIPGPPENNGCPFVGFLINEVLYDPPSGIEGDSNNDGVRDPLEDEFIEFFNSGPELDISGYTISDSDEIRHVFPEGTILPVNGILVVFGGGVPTGDFGGAQVFIASTGQLNMSNSGDLMTLADRNGNPVLEFDIEPLSNNPNESYTRNPDLTGDFVQHAGVDEANGALFSPGTKLDGSNF